MQWGYYTTTKELEALVKEAKDKGFLKLWRYFLISDHLYYMFTAGGSPSEVHVYFSPYDSPMDAFVTAQGAILDFESRLRLYVNAANEPFLFYSGVGEENFTGIKVWSLTGLVDAIQKVDARLIEFHNQKGDFEKWARFSLRDEELAKRFEEVRLSGVQGEKLRYNLQEAAKTRSIELKKLVHTATRSF